MKTRLLILAVFLSSGVFAQNFWQSAQLNNRELKSNKSIDSGEKLFTVDHEAFLTHLSTAPVRFGNTIQSDIFVEIPTATGSLEKFRIVEAPNFAPGLQSQYPGIRAFRGYSTTNTGVSISISISHLGVQTMRLEAGKPTMYIEPVSADNRIYSVFGRSDRTGDWSCATPQDVMEDELAQRFGQNAENLDADDQTLRDFRLALSCTGEYADYFGGTVAGALAGMNATMSRVNPIFERDFAVHLTIIDNNADVVYIDADTDPYSPANLGAGQGYWNDELQDNLTEVIGEANYDVGHLFGRSGGGGNAGCIGCVCVNGSKGSGYTSPANAIPEGDTFDIDYVAHELGHQFGANHTFSRWEGTNVNHEPGSGTTIMSYAGITGNNTDILDNAEDYFHYSSIRQVTFNIKNKTCPTETNISNQPPVADAGSDYAIPSGTPFILTGSGSDPDSDVLTYTWEQIDASPSYNNGGAGGEQYNANPHITVGPLNRSFYPSTLPVRYVPSWENVLNGDLFTRWESLSHISRNMNFALQVRDNSAEIGQTDSDQITVQVIDDNGPFMITEPNNSSPALSGTAFEIQWNVAGTNQAPINTATVDIYLSTDGGENFDLIAEGVENDGAHTVTMPANSQTDNALIMIQSVGNIFYAVSEKFFIDYDVVSECETVTASGLPRNITDNSTSFALGTFSMPDIGLVDEISLNLNVTHTWVGDLEMLLQSSAPSTQITLWDNQCNISQTGTQNFQATFSTMGGAVDCSSPIAGDIAPYYSFNDLKGHVSQGNWIVGIRDVQAQDSGTFDSATLTICGYTASPLGTASASQAVRAVQVYPNPSTGVFNISTNIEGSGVELGVYDMTGKLIYTMVDKDATGKFEHQLNLSKFTKGVYILQAKTGSTITSKKLILK